MIFFFYAKRALKAEYLNCTCVPVPSVSKGTKTPLERGKDLTQPALTQENCYPQSQEKYHHHHGHWEKMNCN